MRHAPTVLLYGTFIAHKRNDTAWYVRGCVPPSPGALWCHGLVQCACREANARALQGVVPCGEGGAAPSCVLPTGCVVRSPERPVAPLLL